MTCSEFIQHFSDYLDGEAAVRIRAERHLDGCRDCRRYLEVYERGSALARDISQVHVSDGFQPELQFRIGLARARAGFEEASGSGATSVTALGMALLLVVAAWSPRVVGRPPVDLAPIVVSNPAPRPLGFRPRPVGQLGSPGRSLGSEDDRWVESNDLLFQYSPLAVRAGYSELRRSGLD